MLMDEYFFKTTKNVISALEDDRVPFANYLLTFILAIILRYVVESFSQQAFNSFDQDDTALILAFLHTTLSYVVIAAQIILLLYCATRGSLLKIAKVVLPAFIFLLATPSLDLLITNGVGHDLTYFLPPMDMTSVLKNYFTYCSYYDGATPGVRMEVFVFLAGLFYYLRVKNKSIVKSLLYTGSAYTLIFIWSCSPLLIKLVLDGLGFYYDYSSLLMLDYFALLSLFLGAWLLFLIEKNMLLSLLRRIAVNYLVCSTALLAGVFWSFRSNSSALTTQLFPHSDVICATLFSLISLLFAAAFIAISKDSKNFNQAPWIGFAALTIAGLYAALAGAKPFIVILFVVGCDFIRYMPPLRLGRLQFLLVLSANSKILALAFLGHLFIKNQMLFQKDFFFIFLCILFFSSLVPYCTFFSSRVKEGVLNG